MGSRWSYSGKLEDSHARAARRSTKSVDRRVDEHLTYSQVFMTKKQQ